ncbi:hypothetical protein [Streptomyces sp. NPDC052107]|uniref:hypothetical protein n=1 Tax=Streptomyces sp. NPDC052107 TaxID=3155632 RepID=UPI003423F5EA
MSGKSDVSAVPAHLYSYSDRCTHAAQELQDFLRGTLIPALHAYISGAAARGEGVNVDIGAVLSRVSAVEDELPRHITEAYRTDRDVRTVGLAFQLAGGGGALSPPLKTVVHSSNDKIAGLTAQYEAGAAAAARLPWPPAGDDGTSSPRDFYNSVYALLAQNADNPEFCRGLLQAGGPQGVQKLLLSLEDNQFQGNLKDGTLATDLVTKILRNGLADPQIAAELAPSLATVVPEALHWHLPYMPKPEIWAKVLPVVTAVIPELHDPAAVARLTQSIGEAIPKDFSSGDLKRLTPQLGALMAAGTAHSIPSHNPHEKDIDWAERYGQIALTEMLPYLKAIKAADLSTNDKNALIRSLIQGAYLNVAFMPLGVELAGAADIAYNATMGALQSWVGSQDDTDTLGLGKLLKDTHPDRDVLALNNLATKAGEISIISTLLAQGRVLDANGKPVHFGHDPAAKAAELATPDAQKKYTVGRERLDQILNDFRARSQDLRPGSPLNKLLGE